MNEINLMNETDLRVKHNDLLREAQHEQLVKLVQEPRPRRLETLRCRISAWLARLNERTAPDAAHSKTTLNRRSTMECRARLDATGIGG